MYYEINIARNGKHFFATAERSITTKETLKEILEVFKEKFTKEDGYAINVTYWEKIGHYVDANEVK